MKLCSFFALVSFVQTKESKKLTCAVAELYQGQVSTTRLGLKCQKWNTRKPHFPKVTPKVKI